MKLYFFIQSICYQVGDTDILLHSNILLMSMTLSLQTEKSSRILEDTLKSFKSDVLTFISLHGICYAPVGIRSHRVS